MLHAALLRNCSAFVQMEHQSKTILGGPDKESDEHEKV